MQTEFHDLTMLFEGEAGQGIQTVAAVLLPILRKSGFNFNTFTEYMSRIRGGSNTIGIRVTGKPRSACVARIDVLFAMSSLAASRLEGRLHAGSLIFAGEGLEGGFAIGRVFGMPIRRLAAEAGGELYASSVVAGAASALLGISGELVAGLLQELFSAKGESVVTANRTAADAGRGFISTATGLGPIFLQPFTGAAEVGALLMDGTTALGLGALLAGCNFISSYPMSPGTGLLNFLAGHAAGFGIVVDQAEDEIAAINAALGASYAGARAIVTTSGGGFDLMQEGVSLAGMIETPVVIHVGQRPGPATGLPTRTGQEDLSLVIHAGHGEFVRAVFAPGSLAELIETVRHACNLAQRFQIPVVILTDQYLLDAAGTLPIDAVHQLPVEQGIVETRPEYRRFALTDDGITPRGIPGFGEGIVRIDSDEHDEAGLITESFAMRREMVQKRLRRLGQLKNEALPPMPIGLIDSATTLVACWGSNRGVVEEALDLLGSDRLAGLHFAQVFPLQPDAVKTIADRRIVVIENNATGQFADLLSLELGRPVDRRILKATGEPFAVEEVLAAFEEELHG